MLRYIANAGGLLTVACLMLSSAVAAEDGRAAPPVKLGADYTLDFVGVDAGDSGHDGYLLDNLNVTADVDLDQMIGLSHTTAHLHILNNLGGMPNNAAGSLQGINNIEVASQKLRLFEAWVERGLGARTTARVGLYDMNSEFYNNDAAAVLLAPAFGVGSEIAATGPNGPSIFPSTALAVRLDAKVGKEGYARAAVINADARTVGDPHGVDTTFHNGALVIGEIGVGQRGKLAVGAWAYTRAQDDVRLVDRDGRALRRGAHGGYVIVQRALNDQEGPWATQAFVRAGISDGRTTAFKGGWQAGLLIARPLRNRPDSLLSIGANQALLAPNYRRLVADDGVATDHAESAVEVTYADTILPHVTLQPDIQWIFRPAGERARDNVLAFTLRLGVTY